MTDTSLKTQDIVITRIFDAPRHRVWQAMTEPEMMKRWWGPTGFTCPAAKIDFRIGGKYHFCMRSPEGQDMWSTGTYKEIVPEEKIVNTDSFADEKGNIVSPTKYGMPETFPEELLVTFTFEEQNGKTKFKLVHSGMPVEMVKDCEIGWGQCLDKLAAAL